MRRGLEEDGYMILSVTFGTAWGGRSHGSGINAVAAEAHYAAKWEEEMNTYGSVESDKEEER